MKKSELFIRVGDRVGYKSTLADSEFQHVAKVRDIWPNGIPSCQRPMLLLEGKSGCVLANHCTKIP
ncbi:MAG: hypothetical protein NTY77_05505 [Elusimicrobia bacterium]|nr:hypothetical protein [Elusimicrobiota bacterium]